MVRFALLGWGNPSSTSSSSSLFTLTSSFNSPSREGTTASAACRLTTAAASADLDGKASASWLPLL
jgi:hypothetical protein